MRSFARRASATGPTAKSAMSIISCTSPSPSALILPFSSATSVPSASLCSRNSAPKRRTASPRFGAGTSRQRARSLARRGEHRVDVRRVGQTHARDRARRSRDCRRRFPGRPRATAPGPRHAPALVAPNAEARKQRRRTGFRRVVHGVSIARHSLLAGRARRGENLARDRLALRSGVRHPGNLDRVGERRVDCHSAKVTVALPTDVFDDVRAD